MRTTLTICILAIPLISFGGIFSPGTGGTGANGITNHQSSVFFDGTGISSDGLGNWTAQQMTASLFFGGLVGNVTGDVFGNATSAGNLTTISTNNINTNNASTFTSGTMPTNNLPGALPVLASSNGGGLTNLNINAVLGSGPIPTITTFAPFTLASTSGNMNHFHVVLANTNTIATLNNTNVFTFTNVGLVGVVWTNECRLCTQGTNAGNVGSKYYYSAITVYGTNGGLVNIVTFSSTPANNNLTTNVDFVIDQFPR